MLERDIKDEGTALAYLVDCTLATVSGMAMLKRRKKAEYQRQISIAQTGYDWMKNLSISIENHRANKVAEFDGDVAAWAKSFEPQD